jgi:putative endonuclease
MNKGRRSQQRQEAHRFGLQAERIAGLYLICKGYRILAERHRNPYGEIDLLARKGGTIIAVEVKARQTLQDCMETVTPHKQQKIARAMQGVLAGHGGGKITGLATGADHNIRFDVVWIAPWKWPVHIKDAWRM